MNSPEAFYLHISGTQRGPYTIPQIDHLLHSGLIAQETLYWREGLEQWQPVTDLIVIRKKPNRWIRPAIAAGVLLLLAIPVRIFGPVVLEGWREVNQHEFTASASYWRAREIIRSQVLPAGTVVEFDSLETSRVELRDPDAAQVTLGGIVNAGGSKAQRSTWTVALTYDPEAKQWSGRPIPHIGNNR
ncbi:MAG TPA: DUF4339 domain-containing protein [Chthoniobacteraceae bacterium]|jgi:hypothetical protein